MLSRPSIRELTSFLFSLSQQPCPRRLVSKAPSTSHRPFSTSPCIQSAAARRSTAPKSHNRGPASKEDTQTDFGNLNVLGNTPAPSTSIDACLWDGFHLNSGMKIVGGQGVLLVGGEAFSWCPWLAAGSRGKYVVGAKGRFDVEDEAWGLLGLVWPKPDILILGLGKEMRPISPRTRQYINSLGIRIDIQDTRNAAAQFNLLATERGVGSIAAALMPIGWRDGVGVK
ncbi:DUF498 domain protein [Calycina marina]|uniref:DUF498 domain protein n=1 Tax=Calycina marina TaxID=1763456 RepID=A0A9P7Z1A0_9HELO|nr:DUF498 domain protein [Calycina marina]